MKFCARTGIKCDIMETRLQNIAYGLPSVGRVQFAAS